MTRNIARHVGRSLRFRSRRRIQSVGRQIHGTRLRVRHRRIRVYGVGIMKTGTTTLARMFNKPYVGEHEIEYFRIVPVAIAALQGRADPALVERELRRRDRRFGVDVDSAHFLGEFIPELAGLFPDARFVLTIRDCFSWLDSAVDAHARGVPPPGVFREYRGARFNPHPGDVGSGDDVLAEHAVPPVLTLLRHWASANKKRLADAPADRTLVIRTEDLDASASVLAAFSGADPDAVCPSHANVTSRRLGLLAAVPTERVLDCAEGLCAPIMEQYWGSGWRDLMSRIGADCASS